MDKSTIDKVFDFMADFMADFMFASFVGAQALRRVFILTSIFGFANIATGFIHRDNPILTLMAIINLLTVSIYTGAFIGSQ